MNLAMSRTITHRIRQMIISVTIKTMFRPLDLFSKLGFSMKVVGVVGKDSIERLSSDEIKMVEVFVINVELLEVDTTENASVKLVEVE